jgi:integrase
MLTPLQKMEAPGAPDLVRRCFSLCSQVFRYAVVQGLAESNPAANIKPTDVLKPYKKGHFSSIDTKELPGFVKSLKENKACLYPITLLAIELMLLTFVRTSEMIKTTWDEIDLGNQLWIISGSRMKMKRDHIIPLSGRSVEIFKE